jgi:hypothetical protein
VRSAKIAPEGSPSRGCMPTVLVQLIIKLNVFFHSSDRITQLSFFRIYARYIELYLLKKD